MSGITGSDAQRQWLETALQRIMELLDADEEVCILSVTSASPAENMMLLTSLAYWEPHVERTLVTDAVAAQFAAVKGAVVMIPGTGE